MSDWPSLLADLPAASPLGFDLNQRRCLRLDLSAANPSLAAVNAADARAFGTWIAGQVRAANAEYAAGGYGEDRAMYRTSPVFASPAGVRTVHLAVDLWCAAGTRVQSALPGVVHSTRDNTGRGNYGPTVIMEHQINQRRFYTLYGHLTAASLVLTRRGQRFEAGAMIGWVGESNVNGGWPPHLHFQVIDDLRGHDGDHPGVCLAAERQLWLSRCPDPNLLLRIRALGA